MKHKVKITQKKPSLWNNTIGSTKLSILGKYDLTYVKSFIINNNITNWITMTKYTKDTEQSIFNRIVIADNRNISITRDK